MTIPPGHVLSHKKNLRKRPDWGTHQVLNPPELKVGHIYWLMHKDPGIYDHKAVLLSEPSPNEEGEFIFTTTSFPILGESKPIVVKTHYCVDVGLMASSHGAWNQVNYVLRTNDKPLSIDEVDNLLLRSPLSH